jgi:magnesium-transporting ATPase (P-type)
MFKWLKGFNRIFTGVLGLAIVIGLSVYALIEGYSDQRLFVLLAGLVPLVLVLLAAVGLALKNLYIASFLVLFIGVFRDAGRPFIYAITSFDFSSMSFATELGLSMVLHFLIFLFLFLFTISCFLDGKFKTKMGKSEVYGSILIAFLFFYIRSGAEVAVFKVLPPLVAILFGSPLFAVVLLLAGVAEVPFVFLDKIFESEISTEPLSYFIFTAFAFYLIYGAVKGIISHKK